MRGNASRNLTLFLILLFILQVRIFSQAKSSSSDLTVLQNVGIIDVAGGKVLPGMIVEISRQRIRSIRKSTGRKYPPGTRVIDLTGRYLLPGFVEMHAHLLLHDWDEEGNIKPRYERAEVERMMRLLLAYGITTVRDPGSETEAAVTFRQLVENNKLLGPRIFTAGRILNTGNFNPEPFVIVRNEQEIRDEIKWQAAAGVDFIKVYAGMPPEFVKAAIDEAHKHGLKVIGHLQRTSWTEAARLGINFICHAAPFAPEYLSAADQANYEQTLWGRVYWLEHLDLNSPQITSMADLLAERRVVLDPTLIAMRTKFFGNSPEYVNSTQSKLFEPAFKGWAKGSFTASWTPAQYLEAQKQWGKLLALTKLLFDHGAILTVGTDTPSPWIIPGASFHQELELLSDAGIPNQEIIKMATINGARALQMKADFGEIRVGAKADLIVLRANPLTDIKNSSQIELVIKSGNIFNRKKLLDEIN